MDGIHDLGGKHGHGRVVADLDQYDPNELPFPERWHGAVFSMVRALYAHGVTHNTDQFRHAIERIDPASYLSHGYYGRWIGGVETLLVEAGVCTQQEITQLQEQLSLPVGTIAAHPAAVPDRFDQNQQRTTHASRTDDSTGLFKVGDPVLCGVSACTGHTRLPAYLRGVQGEVIACHGRWVFPDTNAHGQGEQPQHLYTVEFSGPDLWAATGEDNLSVCVDLFEPYLEALLNE